ncbi:AbrB/MazE/SpoVT family DNA-binding domain-containing protein [Natrinema sp. DC36]|uniref:AbrB/MazE/SpoVT family DNA-binding domain-containing protein n=1 Tax=Natrinema sp. DC36 TaxID=2878680 RepID=UPI001CEFDCBF|nr:AbrB/MazE/SpoVT family DNA-binding domain-containing protein [Natrinema sp. DC36]
MRVSADDGCLPLPKSIRERFGEEFELIERSDRLILVPIPDDPLEALRDEAAASEKTAAQLEESALKEALEEAGE